MKRYLALLALPLLAACGDAADESDDPPAAGAELTAGEVVDPASTATPALPDAGLTDPAATNPAAPAATGSPADPATVPATNQGARYQDSVTESPEAAP